MLLHAVGPHVRSVSLRCDIDVLVGCNGRYPTPSVTPDVPPAIAHQVCVSPCSTVVICTMIHMMSSLSSVLKGGGRDGLGKWWMPTLLV